MARIGFLEEKVFSAMGYYPWECSACRKRLMLKSRGQIRRKRSSAPSEIRVAIAPAELSTY